MSSARVALLLPLLGLPQESAPKDPRFGPAAVRAADARLAAIRDEASKPGAEPGWAGRYYRGDGLGMNVTVELAPKAGFVFTWTGCMGLYDRNDGAVAEKDGRLDLAFTFPNVQQGFRGLAPALVPVKWGERRYLIASDQLRGFANDVNGGSEPRPAAHGQWLLRNGDEARPAPGKPELPKEIATLLLDKPVEGTIVAVHETRTETRDGLTHRITEATVGRGQEHGLWIGMALYFTGAADSAQCTVVELTDHTARIRIRDWRGERAAAPEPGWKWSTRAWWNR
jgi:hypothetical protein